eukprot:m.189523 g.189523  ORF g.189523 m.189523 type:complete len:819 (+) comp15430_c0_seq5:43-2499(+)
MARAVTLLLLLCAAAWAGNPSVKSRGGNIVLTVDVGADVLLERVGPGGQPTTPASPIVSLTEMQTLINASVSAAVAPLLTRIETLEARLALGQSAQASLASSAAADRSLAAAALLTEAGRASAAEAAVSTAVAGQGTQLAASTAVLAAGVLSDRTRTLATDTTLNTSLLSEVSRAIAAENALSSGAAVLGLSLSASSAIIAASVVSERTRALAAEGLLATAVQAEASRAVAVETSLMGQVSGARAADALLLTLITLANTSILTETSRALGAETSVGAALAREVSLSRTVEGTLSAMIAAANTSIVTETSRGLFAEGSVATVLAREISTSRVAETFLTNLVNTTNASIIMETNRGLAAEASGVARAQAVEQSLATSVSGAAVLLAQETQRAMQAEFSIAASLGQTRSFPFSCTPTAWTTVVGFGTAGCDVTVTLPGPSIVTATATGHVSVATGTAWQWTGLSFNGDNDFVASPCCPIPGVLPYAIALTTSNTWENQRTSRSEFFSGGTVTIAVRFYNDRVTGSTIAGYAMNGMVITSANFTASNTFWCVPPIWENRPAYSAGTTLCTTPAFTLPAASLVYSYYGAHAAPTATGFYSWVSFDLLNLGIQTPAGFASLNAAFSSNPSSWVSLNNGRVVTLARGAHNASIALYVPASVTQGAANLYLNGGGLNGFFMLPDTTIAVPQTFACSDTTTYTLSTTVTSYCATTITLPYRATVWAEFSLIITNAAVTSKFSAASISFNGDAVPGLALLTGTWTTTDPNLQMLGMAYTESSFTTQLSQGRTISLGPGTHVVSIATMSSTSAGRVFYMGMTGYFVRAF